ncbi:SMC-Scp complex subunit ScpB [Treponema pectinovorum]|uniref:SMC-Scp complex subunit ScpB n=1 Tax=Treponema pectinovorum TaxID=164 RepID=UPI0036F3DDD1
MENMDVNLEKEMGLVETVLFLDSEPLTLATISKISSLSQDVVEQCLEGLKEKYTSENSGIELSKITGGWTLTPKKEFWEVLKERYGNKNAGRLSRSAMEVLSIIAYKQPITRAEIESIRGVPPDNMIRLLEERLLVKEVGKKDAPGRPSQFGTTKDFLKFFGLNSIADLPRLDEKESERFELAR